MGSFFEAYQKWPPHNQMLFAITAMVIGAAMLFLLAWWATSLMRDLFHYVAVWLRGWPKDESPNSEDSSSSVGESGEPEQKPVLKLLLSGKQEENDEDKSTTTTSDPKK